MFDIPTYETTLMNERIPVAQSLRQYNGVPVARERRGGATCSDTADRRLLTVAAIDLTDPLVDGLHRHGECRPHLRSN
eukprot:1031289-Pyramimonas_sp.AAC.2